VAPAAAIITMRAFEAFSCGAADPPPFASTTAVVALRAAETAVPRLFSRLRFHFKPIVQSTNLTQSLFCLVPMSKGRRFSPPTSRSGTPRRGTLGKLGTGRGNVPGQCSQGGESFGNDFVEALLGPFAIMFWSKRCRAG